MVRRTAEAERAGRVRDRRAQPRRLRRPRRRRLARDDELLRLLVAGLVVAARPRLSGARVRPTGARAPPAGRRASRAACASGRAATAGARRRRRGTSSAPTTAPGSAPLTGSGDVHRVAAGLQFTLPGVPMLFAGDEIGLEGVHRRGLATPVPVGRTRRPGTTPRSRRTPGSRGCATSTRRCAAADCAGRTSTTTRSSTCASTRQARCWSPPVVRRARRSTSRPGHWASATGRCC